MNNIYDDRNRRLKSLAFLRPCISEDMFLGFNLSKEIIKSLRLATKLFIHECLTEYFAKEYNENIGIDEFVYLYKDDIKSLPNITPNGLVLSKAETSCSYNKVLKVAGNIIKYLGITEQIESIHFPVNIRLRWGQPDDYVLSRPYASTKWHSDIWAGESSENVMIHIPIFGDFRNNGITVAKSQPGFYPDFVKHLNDYDEGKIISDNVEERDIDMEIGQAYILDSFLLHKTRFGDPSFRAILSFPVVPGEKLESDIYHNPRRDENYLDVNTWMDIGRKRFVYTDSKLERYQDKDVSKISYADKYLLSR